MASRNPNIRHTVYPLALCLHCFHASVLLQIGLVSRLVSVTTRFFPETETESGPTKLRVTRTDGRRPQQCLKIPFAKRHGKIRELLSQHYIFGFKHDKKDEERAARRAARNFWESEGNFVTDFRFVTNFYHSSSSQQMLVGRKIHYQITTALPFRRHLHA